jgi:two-component system LytT family response regulator
MNKPVYNCIIVDDEHLALHLLENYLLRLGNFNIVEKITNPKYAIDVVAEKKIDLLFLDIQMPQMNGINLLNRLPYQPITIFTTAHINFAPIAYDLGVIDYLVKPFSFERFYTAIKKAEMHLQQKLFSEKKTLQIKSDGTWINIQLHEIVFIEGYKEYVLIHCRQKTYKTLRSMSSLEELLSPNEFLRTHKSYIVSIDSIIGFSAEEIELNTNIKLPISRSKKDIVIERLKK